MLVSLGPITCLRGPTVDGDGRFHEFGTNARRSFDHNHLHFLQKPVETGSEILSSEAGSDDIWTDGQTIGDKGHLPHESHTESAGESHRGTCRNQL